MNRLASSSLLLIVTTSLTSAVLSQELPKTIVGCTDVQCPLRPDGLSTACHLVEKDLSSVGLSRIPTSASPLDGLSWVEGVDVQDNATGRFFDKRFYLGAPPSLDLSNTGACAVFFTQVSNRTTFGTGNPSISQGDCGQAMSNECVSALTNRALAANVTGLASEDACNALQKEFLDNLDPSCSSFATGTKWTGIITRPLSGSQAASAITSQENTTSNCWPIMPKQDNLSLVLSSTYKGDVLIETLSRAFFNITPILTIFYPLNGSIITQAESQMACMKTIVSDSPDSSNGTNTDPGNGAGTGFGGMQTTLLACLTMFAVFWVSI